MFWYRISTQTRATVLVILMCLPITTYAAPEIDPFFDYGMVIQRGAPTTIWGTEDKADRVSASLAGQNREVEVRQNIWKVNFDIPANVSGKQTIEVHSAAGRTSQQVLVGDVWLCSGQSNMAFPLKRAIDGAKIISSSAGKSIRVFNLNNPVAKEKAYGNNKWLAPSDPDAKNFSAVCLAFGIALEEKTGVPTGLINASVSSSWIESWISAETFKKHPELNPDMDRFEKRTQTLKRKGKFESLSVMAQPSQIFDLMIRPRTSSAIKGVIWYQGEGNRPNANNYRTLLRALIEDWRTHWRNPTMPFVVMQLPGFGKRSEFSNESSWAYIRDAQLQAVKETARTSLAVTIDLGDEQLHPKEKSEFGRRAALTALQLLAATDPSFDSVAPVPEAFSFVGNMARVTMMNSGGCLKNIGAFSDAFFLAGSDHRWFPAEGRIDGKVIELKSAMVPRPVAARYAWADRPIPTLSSCNGIVASPFRSDNWELEEPDQQQLKRKVWSQHQ